MKYQGRWKYLTINQGIPINDVANLNITMDISSMEKTLRYF